MTAVQQAYRLFARREARGRSAAYESLAESVADDAALAGFIASLPAAKRQPYIAVTCLQTCPHWQPRRRETPPWSSITPPSCTTSPRKKREQVASAVRSLGAIWLSNEAPGILAGTAGPALDEHMCVLARDGHPIAYTDSHGTWLQWLR